VIHLALQNDSTGSVLRYLSHASTIFMLLLVLVEYDTNYYCSWQNDVFVVDEPGELAGKFLQSVKTILSTLLCECNS
jgi:hypothetical protein